MRCNNCGWDNAPGAENCIKCGYSLQVADNDKGNVPYKLPDMREYGKEQVSRPTVVNAGVRESAPRPTVVGAGLREAAPRPTRIMNSSAQVEGTVLPRDPHECPNCGYPVVGDSANCPNCGTQMSTSQRTGQSVPQKNPQPAALSGASGLVADMDEHVKCQKCGVEVSIEYTFCPHCGERIHLPTISIMRRKPLAEPPKRKCFLDMVLEDGEASPERRNGYEGDTVILNRENTEPGNRTITSREQAELTYEDGKWYIVNKSELCSTFVEAGRKIEIMSGDVIVMGDRRFRFEAE